MSHKITRTILKVSGLFGSLQVVNILTSLIRQKVVAAVIGPIGVGLFGIFFNALTTLALIFRLGLREAGVKEIASGRHSVGVVISILRRWGVWLGVAGCAATVLLSRWFSELAFGTHERQWQFALLGVAVATTVFASSEEAVFQGLGRFKTLAKCSLIGSIGGLVISIPMFFLWGERSVVPSLVAYSAAVLLALLWNARRSDQPTPESRVSMAHTLAVGKGLVKLGFFLTVASVVSSLSATVFLAYLSRLHSVETAGFYSAGFSIVNGYIGMVFTAISMEYFPRLSSIIHSRRRTEMFVSHQIYIVMLVLTALLTLFIPFASIAVELLFTAKFLPVTAFVIASMAGTVLRGLGWSLGYVIVAKGDGRLFMFTEILSCIAAVLLNVAGYILGSWIGLGIAYCVWYLLYSLAVGIIYRRHYGLRFLPRTLLLVVGATLYVAAASALALLVNQWLALPFAIAALLYAATRLRRLL